MFAGLSLAILSGLLDGSTALPLHFVRRWRWENIWLAFCIFEMLLVPWLAALVFVPDPFGLFHAAPKDTLLAVLLFGAGFGVGNLLFGLGITRLGMGLGNAIVVSVTAVSGALVPLVIQHPDRLRSFEGKLLLAALAVLVTGIALCSLAAHERKEERALLVREKPNLVTGIIVCAAAGFFSPCVNFAFAFGQPLAAASLGDGPDALSSVTAALGGSLAILVPALLGAFVVSGAYCSYLLTRNGTWADFRLPGTHSQWFCGFLMGCFNGSAFMLYGVATVHLGSMGAVIGWPIYMAMIILTANAWGWLRGEWRGSTHGTYVRLLSGMAMIVLAIYLVSRVQ